MRVVFIVLWSMAILVAQEHSTVKTMKLAQKGERIAKVMCDAGKLPSAKGTIETIMERIKTSKACRPLNRRKLEAVAYYISNGSMPQTQKHLHVPHDAKCPVCGMYVSKYPKWAASMQIDGKTYYFDGVKDMMKYYIFDGDFPYDRHAITSLKVTDYYTLEAIDAKNAFYVLDPDLFGPMGHELVPFKTQKSAQTFMQEHHGKKIVRFDEITDSMVMALDGIVQ